MKFRAKTSDQISGFLDKGTNLTGELEFAGTLRIDGNFHGSISSDDILVVGEHAMVHADIKVGEIAIHGQVCGNIAARRRIEIFETARVRGDVHTPALTVKQGAMLDGRTRMMEEQSEDTAAADRPPAQDTAPKERLG